MTDGSISKINEHQQLEMQTRSDTNNDRHQRKDISSTLKEWFDPKPQIKEICQVVFWKNMVLEATSLGYIVMVVILLLNTANEEFYKPSPLTIGVFAAFMIYTSYDGWGPMCGCLLNPCAIVGFYLCGRISFAEAFFRMGFEFTGAAIGASIGRGLVPEKFKPNLGPLGRAPEVSIGQAACIEGLLTFNLILVALSVTTRGKQNILHTLTIGCCKATGLIAAGSYTGGLQNPAIAMGPSVASGNFHEHFSVYWIGPLIGSVIAAVVYRIVQFISLRDEKQKQELKRREELAERQIFVAESRT